MTSCDQTSVLDASSIIKIIQACKDTGCRQFKFQSLELTFDAPKFIDRIDISPEDPAQVARDLEFNELRMHEEELATLRLSDPLRYEELMRQNELELDNA